MPNEPSPFREAQIVQRACREMGLNAAWECSRISESEYVTIWYDIDRFRRSAARRVRFSDHVLPDRYKGNLDDYEAFNYEVAYTHGHEEVCGDCFQAIEWVANEFGRIPPAWVARKTSADA